jgi:hypothetical protein
MSKRSDGEKYSGYSGHPSGYHRIEQAVSFSSPGTGMGESCAGRM